MRYRDAGVDIERADAVKESIGEAVRSTWGPGVLRLPRGFAGVIEWPSPGGGAGERTLLAASMDGVGTKLHLALAVGRVADAAADLVYHGANDLLVHGARPLAFLDYVAQGELEPATVVAVVEGLSRACRRVGAALLGGETAQMPDTYRPGVVDVAGCMIGVVAPDRVLDGSRVTAGDVVLGLASQGLHTNGFSLARRVLSASGLAPADPLPGGAGESVADALLLPHRWYGPSLEPEIARRSVHALAHVTGGGLEGNLIRVLPEGRRARLRIEAWPRPAVFRWLIAAGRVPEADARITLNLGIGMAVIVPAEEAERVARELERRGETVYDIGRIEAGARGVTWDEP
jgi:phosphoribosylformylglycinamidine cyclo-ligase